MKNFKGFLWILVAAGALGLATPTVSYARDLQGRLGLGYNGQLANSREAGGQPGLGLKYGFTKDLAMEGILSIATGTPSNSGLGAKFYKNLFFETSLNFYYMLGLGLVKANGNSGMDLQTGFGTEFFIPGVESVGISFEAGAELTSVTGSTVFRTLGLSFLDAGMRFYF